MRLAAFYNKGSRYRCIDFFVLSVKDDRIRIFSVTGVYSCIYFPHTPFFCITRYTAPSRDQVFWMGCCIDKLLGRRLEFRPCNLGEGGTPGSRFETERFCTMVHFQLEATASDAGPGRLSESRIRIYNKEIKHFTKLLEIWSGFSDPGSRIRIFSHLGPDPGSRGKKGTGSRCRIRNTGVF